MVEQHQTSLSKNPQKGKAEANRSPRSNLEKEAQKDNLRKLSIR